MVCLIKKAAALYGAAAPEKSVLVFVVCKNFSRIQNQIRIQCFLDSLHHIEGNGIGKLLHFIDFPQTNAMFTCMYYTGLDPRTMEPVYVATNPHEKAMQRALIQYRNPKNYDLVHEALIKAGRQDLIGFDSKCLIRPRRPKKDAGTSYRSSRQGKKAPAGKAAAGKMVTAKHKKKTIRNIHKKK